MDQPRAKAAEADGRMDTRVTVTPEMKYGDGRAVLECTHCTLRTRFARGQIIRGCPGCGNRVFLLVVDLPSPAVRRAMEGEQVMVDPRNGMLEI